MVSKLAIQDIPCSDCRFLRLIDNSYYNPDVEVTDAILEITLPGASCPVFFYVEKDFNSVFNSSLLQVLSATTYNDLVDLPEGIYKIKYSIAPNNLLYEEFSYLRNCQQLTNYYSAVCKLYSQRAKINVKCFQEYRKKLIWIKELIDAAKYKVEECSNDIEGLELYDEANKLLTNLIITDCK